MYIQDITPTMLKQLPNQTCEILNTIIRRENESGAGIVSMKQTKTSTESGGANVITATFDNGTKTDFVVHNGEKGESGSGGSVDKISNKEIWDIAH